MITKGVDVIDNDFKRAAMLPKLLWGIAGVLLLVFLGLVTWVAFFRAEPSKSEPSGQSAMSGGAQSYDATQAPEITTEEVVSGLDHVWDIGFLPSGEMVFNQRNGKVSLFDGAQTMLLAQIADVYEKGEGGLLGLAIDPNFSNNRYIYTCFNSSLDGLDVRLVRWQVSEALNVLADRTDIITGMPSIASGRHSGCRLAFGPDGYLWVATGDAAQAENPQSKTSLGGKILRVDRDGRAATEGNLSGEFDPRIYSYGHRNSQGLAFFAQPRNQVLGISVEHGPDTDDEVNLLQPGNFGWDPIPAPYTESVPMTDTSKYPEAIEAIWSSGRPAEAPSGAAIIKGEKWQLWNDAIIVAFLRDKHATVMELNSNNEVTAETEILSDFGRLRCITQGPAGNLYIGTDNGGSDVIIRVKPVE